MPRNAESITDTVINSIDAYDGLPVLGFAVSWTASGIEIPHAAFTALLERESFGAFKPNAPTLKIALKRAIVSWLDRRLADPDAAAELDLDEDAPGDGSHRRAIVRAANRDGKAWMSYIVVAEDVDYERLGVEHESKLRFLLNKDTEDLVVTTDERGAPDEVRHRRRDFEDELRPHWARWRETLTTGDVLRAFRGIIERADSIALRRGGGFWFLPDSERETVLALRRLFDNVLAATDGDAFLLTLPQIDMGGARAQLAQAAHEAIAGEVKEMDRYLTAEFLNAPPGTVRDRTIASELTKYQDVRRKAELYAKLLDFRKDEINKEIDALAAKATAIVTKEMDRYLTAEFLNAPPGTVRDRTIASELTKYQDVRRKAELYAKLKATAKPKESSAA